MLDQRFYWNSLGQLDSVSISGSIVARFGYDALGRRVRKTTSSGTFYSVYDGDNVLWRVNADGSTYDDYAYYGGIDQLQAMRLGASGPIYNYALDASHNVAGLIDASGVVVKSYRYAPFGTLESTSGTLADNVNVRRFAGQFQDDETGLYYMRAGYYDPDLARFISEDPIGLAGGINPYVYAGNDPLNAWDPSGLADDSDDGSCIEIPPGPNVPDWVVGCDGGGVRWPPVDSPPFWHDAEDEPGGGGLGGGPGGGAPASQQQQQPCANSGSAPSPGHYEGLGAGVLFLEESSDTGTPGSGLAANLTGLALNAYNLLSFRRGGRLDAQVLYGGSPAYANYAFGVYAGAAGIPLPLALTAANFYAGLRSHYGPSIAMSLVYRHIPKANVVNIVHGYNDVKNGSLCRQ